MTSGTVIVDRVWPHNLDWERPAWPSAEPTFQHRAGSRFPFVSFFSAQQPHRAGERARPSRRARDSPGAAAGRSSATERLRDGAQGSGAGLCLPTLQAAAHRAPRPQVALDSHQPCPLPVAPTRAAGGASTFSPLVDMLCSFCLGSNMAQTE